MVGKWKPIAEYVEPSWEEAGDILPMLFWRARKGAALGYIRDGELFDAKWVYISDAGKATHFSRINTPEAELVALEAFGLGTGEVASS
jgi:hypothetical protein